jgi:hypothetical protein
MKRINTAKKLLVKARTEAKKQDKRRVKRLDKRHAKKLVVIAASPVQTAEKSA